MQRWQQEAQHSCSSNLTLSSMHCSDVKLRWVPWSFPCHDHLSLSAYNKLSWSVTHLLRRVTCFRLSAVFLVPHVYLNPALWTTLPTSTHSPAVAGISLRLRAVAGAKACRHATLREASQGALNYYHGEKMQSFPFMKNMSLISSCLL